MAKRVVVQFPLPLYQETRAVMNDLSLNQADFIRLAVESFLEQRKRQSLERDLAEGYAANAELGRKINEEFTWSDAELA